MEKFEARSQHAPGTRTNSPVGQPRTGRGHRKSSQFGLKNSQSSQPTSESIKSYSKRLTVCLLCLVAAVSTLSPYLSLHLTDQIGLLLLEADLVQLRSCQISSIVSLVFLILLVLVITFSNHCDYAQKNIRQVLPKLTRKLLPLAAIISSLAYLSIVILVPHIKQVQRLPLASFDCDANLITIENCHRPYTVRGLQVLRYILLDGWFESGSEDTDSDGRLFRDLNCLRYNDEGYKSDQVPTNFLLHSCGMVCRPQRRHYHQFGDDLNSLNETRLNEEKQRSGQQQQQQQMTSQVSLKVCFSDEIGGSNYKQYCITNLADHRQQQSPHKQSDDRTLTVGQLNALLRRNKATVTRETSQVDYESVFSEMTNTLRPQMETVAAAGALSGANDDQATHYVNPIIQFESHFKNWPYLLNNQRNFDDLSTNINSAKPSDEDRWCQFRPIPPFIVNNKPFSEIKCSIEHEYTMTTGASQADRIYLKKSSPAADMMMQEADARNERCNIQCKVNILYQVRLQQHSKQMQNHYYLPMKSCNMISGESNKASIIRRYVIFKSIADSALTISVLLIDLLLLVESMDTKQFYLEHNKSRFLGILMIVLLIPLLVSIQFDLIHWNNQLGHFEELLNNSLMPYLHQLGQRLRVTLALATETNEPQTDHPEVTSTTFHFDYYLLPVLNYTIFIFLLAIVSKDLHITGSNPSVALVRISSTEELGMRPSSPKPLKKATSPIPTFLDEKKKHRLEVLLFGAVSLVLGTQFYLSLTVQSLILKETFGSSLGDKKYPAVRSEFSTHTGPAFLVATLALIFKNEISAFFAHFSPFNGGSNIAHESTTNRNRAEFLKYVCLAFAIYSLRFFLLSNLNKDSRIRFPVVFLFYLSELFNFPLVWFALYRRAHELMMQAYPESLHPIVAESIQEEPESENRFNNTARRSEMAFRGHLVVQAGLAFSYFVLARLVALSLHSLNVGLHLHSDNVDWFVTSFQRQLKQTQQSATIRQQSPANATITVDSSANSSNGLFSPLPSERQTYLHASRLFLKYNSLLCLLMATILSVNFLYVKYQIWSEQRRTLNVDQRASRHDGGDDNDNDEDLNEFNQQLSLDLMQVRRDSRPPTIMRLIYPSDISNRSETSTSRAETPRAKVLFHYQVDRDSLPRKDLDRVRSPSSPSSIPSPAPAPPFSTSPPPPPPLRTPQSPVVRVLAVDRDDHRSSCSPSEQASKFTGTERQAEQEIESTTNYRNKSVRIFENQQEREDQEEKIHASESCSRLNDRHHQQQAGERKRTISFAPEDTYIGGASGRVQTVGRQSRTYTTRSSITKIIRTASPEPSIDLDSETSDGT